MSPNELDLPFEPNPPGQTVDLDDAQLAGGLVVAAATIPVPGFGLRPALVFRFTEPDGHFHQPLVLVLDPVQMRAMVTLVARATDAAILAAATI